MRLVSVNGNPDASGVLFDILSERPQYAWISHGVMPSRVEHEAFVQAHPFRCWYLIEVELAYGPDPIRPYFVGALECTFANEIGVHVLKRYQRRGYGAEAVRLFMRTHEPLPPIKAVRNSHWLANIAPGNKDAKAFFMKLGFATIQETLAK